MRRSTIASSMGAALLGGVLALSTNPASAAWQPSRTVEFIVPAGIGGGAGQMAQLIQGIIQKHKLMPVSMVVISKKGGSGAEGFLYVKNHKNDPHKIIITLSNLFTTPLATGSPFSWKDYTPVAMMALDEFVFWVNAKTAYKTPQGIYRRGQEGRRQDEDGRHRLQAGRPDHHRRHRAEDRRQVHLHSLQRGRHRCHPARRRSHRFVCEQPDRAGRALARRQHRARSACSTPSRCPTRPRSPRTWRGATSRPASRRVWTSNT